MQPQVLDVLLVVLHHGAGLVHRVHHASPGVTQKKEKGNVWSGTRPKKKKKTRRPVLPHEVPLEADVVDLGLVPAGVVGREVDGQVVHGGEVDGPVSNVKTKLKKKKIASNPPTRPTHTPTPHNVLTRTRTYCDTL